MHAVQQILNYNCATFSKNRYVNVDDYAGIEETRGMENLNSKTCINC